jgi:hypothetical protein
MTIKIMAFLVKRDNVSNDELTWFRGAWHRARAMHGR